MRLHRFIVSTLLLAFASTGYAYDSDDPRVGAGPEAAWREVAQYDQIDEVGTKDIHKFTTDPKYLTPIVSYIPEHPTVPSPREVLGYISGAEGKLTSPDDEIRYFKALSDASPRVELREMGDTEEGRKMHLVIVTSEDNMTRLDQFRGYMQSLSDPRKTTPQEERDIIAKAKPIMHITAGLHSPETGPPEMVMELAYRLAVSNHPDIKNIRDNVVLLITPITDVDGRAKVVDWYNRYLQDYTSRDYMPSVSPPYWGKYVFHDNNRDGIQMSQKLTQNYVQSFRDWKPIYSLDLHESVPLMYVSGGTGPYNRAVDPITIREWQWAASYELAELQKYGLPGVWTWGFYTGWNPSYLLWVTNNHNSMGRFYETFGNGSARTMERDLSDVKFVGKDLTSPQWYRADPPEKKVTWSLRNNTNYMQSGVLASLTWLSQNGATLLDNFYKKGENGINKGKTKAPHAWVIPTEQEDPSRLAYLINQLRRHDLEVHRANSDFSIGDANYKAGDFIVRLDQPYGTHAGNLLAKQLFPKDADHRPYDDVSWTLGLLYRVRTDQIDDAAILDLNDITLVTDTITFPGTVSGSDPAAYAVKHRGNNTLITARYALKRYDVNAAEKDFTSGGETFPVGSWIIPHKRGLKGELQQVARDHQLDFYPLESIPDVPAHELDLPRIALLHNWVNTQDDGWVRFTFEQSGIPYDYISDFTVQSGGLSSKYDLIIMADQGGVSAKSLVHGRDPKYGPQAYTATREYPSHGTVDSSRDITRGMGFEGLKNLEDFLNRGGTLLLMGSSGTLATEFGLVRNVSTVSSGVETPGSAIQTKILRADHPIAYGYDEVNYVFRTNSPLFSVPKNFDHWIVMQYGTKPLREDDDADTKKDEGEEEPKDDKKDEKSDDKKTFLLSGYVDKQDALETKGAIIDIPRNDGGRVILFSFNPMHRFLNHGDHTFVHNTILNWNDFPDPTPIDHPGLAKD